MDGERTGDTSPVQHPDEVQWKFVVIPLLLSLVLGASVLAYRCRAHRLRRERLAREQHEERREFVGENHQTAVAPGIWYGGMGVLFVGVGCVAFYAQDI